MRHQRTCALLLASLTVSSIPGFAQGFITTIAGIGSAPITGPQPGKNARLGYVQAVALDLGGNLLIGDSGSGQVFKLTPAGLTVVAGNGTLGFGGDNGPAAQALLGGPISLTVDSIGNIYIADANNNRVRKVTPAGVITTFAGTGNYGSSGDGGLATAADVAPVAVAVDRSDNIYIADVAGSKIRKITNGRISSLPGTFDRPIDLGFDQSGNLYFAESYQFRPGEGAAHVRVMTATGEFRTLATEFDQMLRIAVDPNGTVYAADTLSQIVYRIDSLGRTRFAGTGSPGFSGDGGAALNAALNEPGGLAADSAGNVYIADTQNERVRRVSRAGTIDTLAGNGQFQFAGDGGAATAALLNQPDGVKVDAGGNVYVADTLNNRVRMISRSGVISTIAGAGDRGYSGDGRPAVNALLNQPAAVAVDTAGNLYIADTANHVIRKRDTDGNITTFAGTRVAGYAGDGAPAVQAQLSRPRGLATDQAGNLYISDSGNNTVRKVSNGIITTIAGNGLESAGVDGPATSSPLLNPAGIAVDPAGNVYFAEEYSNRVRKISGGTITTVAGTGTPGSSGDGGPATRATLLRPLGVALDSAGNLYIADTYNHVVRKVSGGNIVTVAGNRLGGFGGDGGQSTVASLAYPADVAVDAIGNIYIADTVNHRIREVLFGNSLYQAVPTSLSFSGESAKVPEAQTLILSAAITGLAFTATSNAPWLSVSPSAGAIPATLQVAVDPSGLTVGTNQGAITISVPNAAPAITTISVTFTVLPATAPVLVADTGSIAFTSAPGGAAITQVVRVSNAGGGTVPFSTSVVTSSGGSWLDASPASSAATASASSSVTVTATPGSLPPGTYSGAVTIKSANGTVTLPVTLSLSSTTASILLSQSALSFRAAQGGAPLPQKFGILNTGSGAMTWKASASTLTGGSWLLLDSDGGTVLQPFLDVSSVGVRVDSSGLPPADYYGQIQVSSAAVNSPQVITVVLTVLPAGSSPGPEVRPTGLIFTGSPGSNPSAQDVLVGNPKGQTDGFLSGSIGRAYTYTPTNADIPPNQPATVRVIPDYSSLSPGSIERGTITLQFNDGGARTISVLSVVAPAGAASQGLQPHAAGCTARSLVIQYRSPQRSASANFLAFVGQPTTVEVQIADLCGNLVGPGDPQSPSVVASFSNGDPSVRLVHVGSGIWNGTWRPVRIVQAGVTIAVTAFQPLASGSVAANQVNLSGSVQAAGDTPTVTAEGVVHAASDLGGIPIAPGGLISIYGLNLADSAGQSSSLPLPPQLNGTRVLLGNQPLPILYTNPGQLNVQVPYGVPVNTQYQLTVQHGNAYSVPQALVVAPAQPGIFTVNQTGSGQGSIVRSDGVTLAQPGSPAAIGETVVIYCTGLGAVTPKVPEGVPAPDTPLSTTDNAVSVTIGGKSATVTFNGLTPGNPGLYQVNAVVPSGTTPGDAVPVVISVAGQTSPINPAVTMAVR